MMLLSHGDLLEAPEDIIVHQVNCQGKMNSGIARQMREKWPDVYKAYMNVWRWNEADENSERRDLLGTAQVVAVGPNKFVVNLFGQNEYGYDGQRYTSYDALYDGLTYIKEKAKEQGLSVAIPFKIGCDRGGADWFIVDSMIQRIFADYKVHLYKLEEK